MTMRRDQIQAIKERLLAERDRLRVEIEGEEQAVVEYSDAVADEDHSYGNHLADDATDTYEQERNLALKRNLQTVYDQINEALRRIEQGTYGICETCGQEIPIERLEARPYATRCVADQAREEQQR